MESDALFEPHRPQTCRSYLEDCIDRFRIASWDDSTNRKVFYGKVGVICAILALTICATFTGMGYQDRDVDCIWDGLFKATASANHYIRNHDAFRHTGMILSSLLMDILALSLLIRFVLYATSWRTLLCVLMFYLIRAVIQSIFVMEFPDGYIWDYPGFPSLVVSYKETSDFFYSGHMGFIVICFFDNLSYQNYFLVALSIFSISIEFFVLLLTRTHYSIDLFTGVIMGHYCWIISASIAPWVDRWIGAKVVRSE